MSKLPAFQFYPGDWRKDPGVQSLDYQCRGVWFEILCLMHESDNRGVLELAGRPMADDVLARLLGLDPVLLKQILTFLIEHGVASRDERTGALVSRRMVRDEKLRKIRAECGKKGGNPGLLNQISTTGVKQIPTPSSSSSASSSDSLAKSPAGAGQESDFSFGVGDLIDTLVSIDGSDPKQATGPALNSAAVALGHILEVAPNVTPDEIAIRAKRFKEHYRNASITPHALAKHWALCGTTNGNGGSAKTLVRTGPNEPDGWKAWLNHNLPDSIYSAGQKDEAHAWSDMPTDAQWHVVKQMQKGNNGRA